MTATTANICRPPKLIVTVAATCCPLAHPATGLTATTAATRDTQTSALATAVDHREVGAIEADASEVIMSVRTRTRIRTSTVPKLREVQGMTPCPSGLLGGRIMIVPGKMLNLLKVLRMNETPRANRSLGFGTLQLLACLS
jgi:hypothetical protein